jgi:hypothetical protein
MHEALDRAGARTSLLGVHGRLLTHSRIVATLSRTDRPAGAALAAFTDRMKER